MLRTKSLTRGIRSLFKRRATRSTRRRVLSTAYAESLEPRELLVVGALALPPAVAAGTGFDGVVRIDAVTPGTTNIVSTGSGVLLEDGLHVLTAAHVVDGFSTDDMVVTFTTLNDAGDPYNVVHTVPAVNRSIHSGYDATAAVWNDLGVLRLPEVAPANAERYEIYNGGIGGQTMTFVGYGRTGTGTTGGTAGSHGVKRSGTNEVSGELEGAVGREMVFDFDDGTTEDNRFGDSVGLGAAESMIAPGDSGGPALINGQIAGIASRVNNDDLNGDGIRTLQEATMFRAYGIHVRPNAYTDYIRGEQDNELSLVLNMSDQPGANDGAEDTIVVRALAENEFEIVVNGESVYTTENTIGVSIEEIREIQFLGSDDPERIEFDERLGSFEGFEPFLSQYEQLGPVYKSMEYLLGNGSEQLAMGHWTNYFNRYDVDGNGEVEPYDVLSIINELQLNGEHTPGPAPYNNTEFFDVSGDGVVKPLDVLLVINELSRRQTGGGGEGELPTIVDLSTIDQLVLNNEDITVEGYYEFTTSRAGTLSIEALFANAAGGVDIKLYRGLTEIASSASLFGNSERIDVEVLAGESLVLEVSGTNSDVDLRFTNLVQVTGSTVTVNGTSSNDVLTASTNGATYSVDINGTSYSYTGNAVNTIAYTAGAGVDTANLTTSTARDHAFLFPTHYTVNGIGYQLTGSDVEYKHVYSTGGADYGHLYDSTGNDRFYGRPTYSYMSGPGYESWTHGFYRTNAFSPNGGDDRSYLYDSQYNDTYTATVTYSQLRGPGYYNYATGFGANYAISENGGNDTAIFHDSIADDYFKAWSNRAYMRYGTDNSLAYQIGFNNVNLYGNNGGNNTLFKRNSDFLFSSFGSWNLV